MCLRYLTRAVVGAATQEIALEDVMRRPTALSRRLTRLRWIALEGCLTISVKIYFSGFKVLQGQSDRLKLEIVQDNLQVSRMHPILQTNLLSLLGN
jgi:hypothetical protein